MERAVNAAQRYITTAEDHDRLKKPVAEAKKHILSCLERLEQLGTPHSPQKKTKNR